MNLPKLFEIQRVLDARIEKEHPRVEGEDRLAKKILALQVELGELVNELPEVFKFWSNKKNNYEKALKEYVDSLHFILSIGIEHGFENVWINHSTVKHLPKQDDVMINFSALFSYTNELRRKKTFNWYDSLFERFVVLGFSLGFTWEQIEQAYYDKMK